VRTSAQKRALSGSYARNGSAAASNAWNGSNSAGVAAIDISGDTGAPFSPPTRAPASAAISAPAP